MVTTKIKHKANCFIFVLFLFFLHPGQMFTVQSSVDLSTVLFYH